MKYIILSFSVIIFATISARAQTPVIGWEKSLGGTDLDEATCVQLTIGGGYIIAGRSVSLDGDVSGNHGGADLWVVKLDDTGRIQWQRCLGGSNSEAGYTIQQTADSGYIFTGESRSNDGQVTGNHGNYDFWVVKLDDTGAIKWQRSLGGSGIDGSRCIQQTFDGGYIVTGLCESNDGDVAGHHSPIYGDDIWVAKLNDTGNIQWQISLGGSGYEFAAALQQTTDSGYIIAGYSGSSDGDVTGNHGNDDAWVVKLTKTGAILWQKCLGGTNLDHAYSIQQTIEGDYIVAGRSRSNDGDLTANYGSDDFWVIRLNDTGAIQWQKTFGGTGSDIAQSIRQTSDFGYVIAGTTQSNDYDVTGNHGGHDYWVIKIDAIGTLVWQKTLGGSLDDYASSVKQTTDGYIVAGRSLSNDSDVTGHHGTILTDAWIVKLIDTSIHLSLQSQLVTGSDPISITPNPTTGNIVVTGVHKANIEVCNSVGQLIKTATGADNVSIAEFPTGLYLVKVFNAHGLLLKQEKIIKE